MLEYRDAWLSQLTPSAVDAWHASSPLSPPFHVVYFSSYVLLPSTFIPPLQVISQPHITLQTCPGSLFLSFFFLSAYSHSSKWPTVFRSTSTTSLSQTPTTSSFCRIATYACSKTRYSSSPCCPSAHLVPHPYCRAPRNGCLGTRRPTPSLGRPRAPYFLILPTKSV